MVHQANIALHILSGTLALVVGVLAIGFNRRVRIHRRLGIVFVYLLAVVVGTGFVGWLLFRSDPFLLMLTILSGYEVFAGYRIISMRAEHPKLLDVLVAIAALTVGVVYVLYLSSIRAGMGMAVVRSTLVALVLVTMYDILKYFFVHRYVKGWWLYEHIYKMIASFSAILSAFIGTVVEGYRPWSQLGPSVVCVWLIGWFIWRRAREV